MGLTFVTFILALELGVNSSTLYINALDWILKTAFAALFDQEYVHMST